MHVELRLSLLYQIKLDVMPSFVSCGSDPFVQDYTEWSWSKRMNSFLITSSCSAVSFPVFCNVMEDSCGSEVNIN